MRAYVCILMMLVHYVYVLCVADQVYGDQDWHSVVRNQCLDYMVSKLCSDVCTSSILQFACFLSTLLIECTAFSIDVLCMIIK